MIQDITPHILKNQYTKVDAGKDDYLIFFKGREVLCRIDAMEKAHIPKFKDVEKWNPNIYEDDIFLFSVDERPYFLVSHLKIAEDENFRYIDIKVFLESSKRHKGFATVTAFQLSNWYQNHRFCGKCGHELVHADKERMLHCAHCGNMEYPKLAPAVIVGIRNGEYLLMTKYRGRISRYYALVAGFAEIGETIEETVRREVKEEVGLEIKNISYYKSQPWGLTDTLLFGFYADVDGDDTITLDEEELELGKWIHYTDIDSTHTHYSLTSEMIQHFRSEKILNKENK